MSFKKRFTSTFLVGALSLSLISCSDGQGGPGFTKKEGGALFGAIGGAILGSNVGKGKGNVAAIAAGTLLGAALGAKVGESLDKADMAYYNQSAQKALETTRTGTTTPWNNPDSGNSGTFTPVRTFQQAGGQYCREYSQTIIIAGQPEEGHGTACRQPDGTWQIVQ